MGFALSYMDATYDFEPGSEEGSTAVSLDPLMLSISGGFRF